MKKLSKDTIQQIASDLDCSENVIEFNGLPEIRFKVSRGIEKGKLLVINTDGIYYFENEEDCQNDENHIFECEFYRVM